MEEGADGDRQTDKAWGQTLYIDTAMQAHMCVSCVVVVQIADFVYNAISNNNNNNNKRSAIRRVVVNNKIL